MRRWREGSLEFILARGVSADYWLCQPPATSSSHQHPPVWRHYVAHCEASIIVTIMEWREDDNDRRTGPWGHTDNLANTNVEQQHFCRQILIILHYIRINITIMAIYCVMTMTKKMRKPFMINYINVKCNVNICWCWKLFPVDINCNTMLFNTTVVKIVKIF